VEKLWVEDDRLMAELDLHPALAEMVKQGLYKNRSVSLYEYPDGRKYLRHVGFLEAQPPQVKGMKPVELKEKEGAEIKEFTFESIEELRKRQLERAKKYGIAPKPDGHFTKPAEYAHLSDEQFADPVNYKYPIDEAHIRAALSYWGQERNCKGYSRKEQEIISKRMIAAAKKFGINTSLEKEVSNMGEKHFSEEDVQKLLKEERERLEKEFAEKEKSF